MNLTTSVRAVRHKTKVKSLFSLRQKTRTKQKIGAFPFPSLNENSLNSTIPLANHLGDSFIPFYFILDISAVGISMPSIFSMNKTVCLFKSPKKVDLYHCF